MARELNLALGRLIKRRRIYLGLKQSEVSEACGVVRTQIANLESGRHTFTLDIFFQICSALHLKPARVLATRGVRQALDKLFPPVYEVIKCDCCQRKKLTKIEPSAQAGGGA